MATNWYYRRGGRDHGPFTPKQFKSLAAAGIVQPTDMIRKDGMPEGKWIVGNKVDGLFRGDNQHLPLVPTEPVPPPDSIPEAIEAQIPTRPSDPQAEEEALRGKSKTPLVVAAVVILVAVVAGAAWLLL